MIVEDWRYSDERMKAREKVLTILLSKFGSSLDKNGEPIYSSQSIYECSHDWISQGNLTTFGIIKYYEAYYAKTN